MSHREIVGYSTGFINICEMRINALELERDYYKLMSDSTLKFNISLFEEIKKCVEDDIEPDVYRYSKEYHESFERILKMFEIARGLKLSLMLFESANELEGELERKRKKLDEAYEEGKAIGILETKLLVDDTLK